MKQYGIKLGGKGTLKLRRGSKPPAVGQTAPQDGIVPVEDDELILGRLLKKGRITLYDLSLRVIAGVGSEIPQEYHYPAYNSADPVNLFDLDADLLAGDYTQSKALPFAGASYALPNGISIIDTVTEVFDFVEADGWREQPDGTGLFKKCAPGTYESFANYYANFPLVTSPSNVKITALATYASAAVTITPIKKKSKVAVYMVPARPKYRLAYRLFYSDGITSPVESPIELPIISRIPVTPNIYPPTDFNAVGQWQDRFEPTWVGLYPDAEAAKLAAHRTAQGDPTITIAGRVDGHVLVTAEQIDPGALIGIIVIDGDVFYIWSTVFTNHGSNLHAFNLIRNTSWGVVPGTTIYP